MVEQNSISAAQFITAIIALAVALTGWVTLILANRKFRGERAILAIQEIRIVGTTGCEIVIENVGVGVALDIVVSITDDAKVVSGGLRSGERVTVRLPNVPFVELLFSDAIGKERRLTRDICFAGGVPFIAPPRRLNLMKRVLIRTGFVAV
jgi:hypothetical protein